MQTSTPDNKHAQRRVRNTHADAEGYVHLKYTTLSPYVVPGRTDGKLDFSPLRTWKFWRNAAIYFCIFSIVGHWMEIPYCMFMDLFGIVEEDSLVWDDPMYPFCVYGVAVVLCAIIMTPLSKAIAQKATNYNRALLVFFACGVLLSIALELGMGLLLNQPVDGKYPLWDNSYLPLNILGQAWLVNDILLGALMTFHTLFVYPVLENFLNKTLPQRFVNVLAVVIVVGFIILCANKFVIT